VRIFKHLGVQSCARNLSALAVIFAATLSNGAVRAADQSELFLAARLEPSLRQVGLPDFAFSGAPSEVDTATSIASQFSHFHLDIVREQRLENAFAKFEARNAFDPGQVALLLAKAKRGSAAGMPALLKRDPAKHGDKASQRIAAAVAQGEDEGSVVMAFASTAPVDEDTPLAAIAKIAPADDEASLASLDPEEIALPEEIAIPDARPDIKAAAGAAISMKPARPLVVQDDEPNKVGERNVKPERPATKAVALARPENPSPASPRDSNFGQSIRSIFGGGSKAGNGVAVYDISAARVYMPDGSVLEAHSGIGKMADNPRYTHVKMNGPTPVHTYNLRMRERRFHGVEAIRMLPVNGKNKFGRDGFLTHSYLLRGRSGQSHGCVAFKDYNKFLKAFKQGRIKQLVVVASGGRAAARTASR
jgi:hypothetical protein